MDEDEKAFEDDVEAQAKAGDPMAKARAAKAAKAAAAAPVAPAPVRTARVGAVLVVAIKRLQIDGEYTIDNQRAKLNAGDTAEIKAERADELLAGGNVRPA